MKRNDSSYCSESGGVEVSPTGEHFSYSPAQVFSESKKNAETFGADKSATGRRPQAARRCEHPVLEQDKFPEYVRNRNAGLYSNAGPTGYGLLCLLLHVDVFGRFS